jgi:thiamine biosynthesis lipoprotein
MAQMTVPAEASEVFECFGSRCAVFVSGHGSAGSAEQAVAAVKRRLGEWHVQFSRFEPASELALLNADPRTTVPVSPMLARFAETAAAVGALTGGLVDATLVGELEQAGYATHFDSPSLPLATALPLAPPRRPAGPSPLGAWRELSVDTNARTVTRPPGLRLDSGGIAKGLFGDVLAVALAGHLSFAIDCGGDIRLGGAGRLPRAVRVDGPFEDSVLHTFELAEGAVATSGIGRRSWLDADGRPAHHLIDPSTGAPAFTGIVQVTALAPTGVVAEALAKAAILAGPESAATWLPHGGLVVYDDGSHRTIPPRSDS